MLAGNVALTGKDNGYSFVVSGSRDITIKIAAQEAPYTDRVFIRPPDANDASKGVAIQLDNYVNIAAVHGTPGADTVTGAAKGQFYNSRGGGDIIVMSGDESRVNVANSDYAEVTLTGREAVVYGNGGSRNRCRTASSPSTSTAPTPLAACCRGRPTMRSRSRRPKARKSS